MKQYEYFDFAGHLPRTKRNFVRENIKSLKEMQGPKIASKSQEIAVNKFKHVGPKVFSNISTRRTSSKEGPLRPVSYEVSKGIKSPMFSKQFLEKKIIHKGVQTDRPEEVKKLLEGGNMKVLTPSKHHDRGDVSRELAKLELDDKKPKVTKANPLLPPPTYQKGVVPKYLKDKKEAPEQTELRDENLKGLILLPDEERKEYLRVARENYAALIKELNSMPVSNDTLKKRKRKMEIEEELKRLDEVIKIFQKPKVYVKADA